MVRDGIGAVKSADALPGAFTRGLNMRRRRPLADQFVHKILPRTRRAGVPASRVFRRAWDAVVMSLRAGDLISNEEQCKLMYGDAVTGVEPSLPLFLYAGRLTPVLRRVGDIASLASRDHMVSEWCRSCASHFLP